MYQTVYWQGSANFLESPLATGPDQEIVQHITPRKMAMCHFYTLVLVRSEF